MELIKWNGKELKGTVIAYTLLAQPFEPFRKNSVFAFAFTDDPHYYKDMLSVSRVPFGKVYSEELKIFCDSYGKACGRKFFSLAPRFEDREEILFGFEDVVFAGRYLLPNLCEDSASLAAKEYIVDYSSQLLSRGRRRSFLVLPSERITKEPSLPPEKLLKMKLDAAISQERFEEAARLRDEIRKIGGNENL